MRATLLSAILDNMDNTIRKQTKELVRIGTLAQQMGLPVPSLRRLADKGLVPVYRIGPGFHRRFLPREAVQRLQQLLHMT